MTDTIFALSSGSVPSGIAVVRLSGLGVRFALETTVGDVPLPRQAQLRTIWAANGTVIDRGLVLFFAGPHSFTGEDSAEFHLHGGRAVVAALLDALGGLPGLRLAAAGEFSRRAYDNGKLDLTAAEGLADLIAAETENQRQQAIRLAGGAMRARADAWRTTIIALRAAVEAGLDFSDEDDVPDDVAAGVTAAIAVLAADIEHELAAARRGERIRDGFEVVVLGPPNAGKSSLVNAIADRDVAIVTAIAGTTRDLLEVRLDLGGYAVTLVDTAGLRDGGDMIEVEGMRRGLARAAGADVLLWLDEQGRAPDEAVLALGVDVIEVETKADLGGKGERRRPGQAGALSVSVQDSASVDRLVAQLTLAASTRLGGEPALVSRARQRDCLHRADEALMACLASALAPELVADRLREAGDALAMLTGRIDVEEVLGAIFSSFCIGK